MRQHFVDINNGIKQNIMFGKAIQYVGGEKEWQELSYYIGKTINEKTLIEKEIFNNIIKKFEPNATHIRV
jgi:hypothetical protein